MAAWLFPATTHAQARPTATFALIIGVNKAQEPGLVPLRFADDDALKSAALFRTLGSEVLTLSDPDANTRRLFGEARDVKAPTANELQMATNWLKQRVMAAHEGSQNAVVYFVYAGHGARDATSGEGFLTLADGRLDAATLFATLVDKVKADTFHVIVDACNSQFLAEARGPGGQRRVLSPFAREVAKRALDGRVGLMFATSLMTKTFEYEGFAAGVFSHLVRSGLQGAADVDLDGLVTYDELQRFVALAAEPIANELYRPRVHAFPPHHTQMLADLRPALHNQIFVSDTAPSAHYAVEDRNGVRLLDFHNAPGQPLHVVWPQGMSLLFVFDDQGTTEVELAQPDGALNLASIAPHRRRAGARGAAEHAFRNLFALPFSAQRLAAVDLGEQAMQDSPAALPPPTPPGAKAAFWTAGALAATSLVAYGVGYLTLRASKGESQERIVQLNQRAHMLEWVAGMSLGLAAGAAATGWVLVAMPRSSDNAHVDGLAIALSAGW